jgi:ketosteroid isomerase-like protein
MRRSNWLLVLTCVAVMACTQDMTRRELMLEQQAVEAQVNAWVRAMSNAQLDSLLLYYDDSETVHVVWPDGRMAKGSEGVDQVVRDFYGEIQYMNFAMSQLEVEVLGPTIAQAVFRHSTDVVDRNNQRAVFPGRGVLVLVKDADGSRWKIHTQLLSVNRQSEN